MRQGVLKLAIKYPVRLAVSLILRTMPHCRPLCHDRQLVYMFSQKLVPLETFLAAAVG